MADPNVVVLTPGVYNSAYFEHSLLARQMGVELVEGRDLFCRDNAVYMRTTQGEQRVDVIYRRIDDEFLDPLQFNADSVLGVAGVLNAARAGNVVIANAVGNGVGDDKLVYTYVPEMLEVLPRREADPAQRRHVPLLAARRAGRRCSTGSTSWCVKPVEGSGGYGIVFGPNADRSASSPQLRRRIRDDPRGWIAQPVVQLSTVPTKVDDRLVPRHVDLRPFAVNDGNVVFVLPGGLTRVALPEGSLVVNSIAGRRHQGHLGARRPDRPTADAELGGHRAGRRSGQAMPDSPPPSGARS